MADRYWIASSAGDWDDTTNWSTTSGGSGGASVPGSSDKAIFDGNGTGDCTLDIAPSISSMQVTAAYTGTVDTAGNNLTIGGGLDIQGSTGSPAACTFRARDSTVQVGLACYVGFGCQLEAGTVLLPEKMADEIA